jgi:hypothetical protein
MRGEVFACVECGGKTTRLADGEIPLHRICEENRDEAAYERRMRAELGGGGGATPFTPAERMDDAYETNRRQR